ncbi:MAG: hypothetical protein GY760_23120 [Deltaproteobacteria bacterium]|nr:hypothetical protein [Deltaproteobacteria bacterium]
MSWNHIVVEGHFLIKFDVEFDKLNSGIKDYIQKNGKVPPKCCKYHGNRIGSFCLKFHEEEYNYCPFFAFGTAKSSIILTNNIGEEAASDTFWIDNKLKVKNAAEWAKQEEEWLMGWKDTINKQSG